MLGAVVGVVSRFFSRRMLASALAMAEVSIRHGMLRPRLRNGRRCDDGPHCGSRRSSWLAGRSLVGLCAFTWCVCVLLVPLVSPLQPAAADGCAQLAFDLGPSVYPQVQVIPQEDPALDCQVSPGGA